LSGATNATLSLTNVQTNQAGIYAVLVTNAYGSVTSSNVMLTVYVPPTITAQPLSQGVTQGQPVSFSVVASGSSPLAYQWYFNGSSIGGAGAQSSTYAINNAGTGQAGNYTVVVTNAGGSVTSLVAVLAVYVPPQIQGLPANLTVTQGQTASFSVTVNNGTAPFSYQWNLNGTALGGATNAALTLTNVQASQAGSYTVVVTNFGGCVTSGVETLTVNVPAAITTQPQSQTVLLGQSASFSVAASGTPNLKYQWYLNGSSLGGGAAQNPTLTFSAAGTNNAGNYTVVVNNNYGSATSAVVTLTVNVPAAITTQPGSQTVALRQSASFSVVAAGTPPLSYQWSFSGSPLSGATNAALSLTNVWTNSAGSYLVVVTNIAGSVTSSVVSLTVTNPVIALSVPGGAGMTPAGFTFHFSAPVGVTCVILSSTDLQAWTPIATNVATEAGVIFTDSAAANFPVRVYRVVIQ